ncbi:MAG: response regulator [Bacteroidota bacterium]|nr:response regulator [Bacteroidota bacterium]
MAKVGPIMIIEDDKDDREILQEIIESLGIKNELRFFGSGQDALDYLMTTSDQPFIILSDVNLPKMTGIELRQRINESEYLRQKSIPFIFLTTTATPIAVKQAYDMMVQGFFQKELNYAQVKYMVKLIFDYWSVCKHPNNTW